jgi:riboflavin biosynthesis pyrimidine reductase
MSASGQTATLSNTLWPLYLPFLPGAEDQDGSCIIGHLGQSLDGYIATANGDSCFVTGPENITHLHRMRALADAVLVGAGTVAADDPRLTTRLVPGPNPVRVVLDPDARLPVNRQLFTDALAPTLLCQCRRAARGLDDDDRAVMASGHPQAMNRARFLFNDQGYSNDPGQQDDPGQRVDPGHLELLELPEASGSEGLDGGGLDLVAVVDALRERGLKRLFVEGGGVTVSRFLRQGLLDRLQIAVAPLIIGAGRRGLTLPASERLADALRPQARCYRMGADVLFDCDLRANRA